MGKINGEYFNCFNSQINKSNTHEISCDLKIGLFLSKNTPLILTIISSLGFLSNFIVILNFLFKSKKNKERSTRNTMKKLFAVLQILDCIQSLYWIISSLFFKTANDIKNNSKYCSILSLTYIFVINFEFLLMNFLLNNFRRISSNPIHGIFKPYKNIFKYIFVSCCFGGAMSMFAYYGGSIGRSPLITCFLNTEEHFIANMVILIFPIVFICFIIYQIIYDLYRNKLFVSDKNVRKLYKKNSFYVLISSLLYLPMIILMLLSMFKYLNSDKRKYYFKEINNFTIILTCSIPLIINLMRVIQGFTKLSCSKKLLEKNIIMVRQRTKTYRNTLNKDLNEKLSIEEQYSWLETHSIEYFIRDIFIGISTALKKSTEKYGSINQVIPSHTQQSVKYTIHFGNFCLDDETVEKSDYLDIKLEEFAPKCFAYLRNLENIDMNEMIEQFLPKNNKKGINESQGKSGSFFISTDDSKYLIKTLKVEEFELIKNQFLYKYCKYLAENPKSLLSRLYGMYNLNVNQGKDNILIIVMRNVIGDFQDNIIAKFDLKGSSFKRKSFFDIDKIDEKTMKDNNFDEIEHRIFLSKESSDKLRKICKKDSEFLRDMELMDYSLFLIKITLPKEEAIDIFGKNIIKDQMRASDKILISEDNKSNKKVGDVKRNYSVTGEGKMHDIEYYKPYLYPSINIGSAYILSIIDYLQIFNFFKYLESELKTRFRKDGKKIISCVDPQTYSDRFINYIIGVTEVKDILKSYSNDGEIKDNDISTFNTGELSVTNINNESNMSLDLDISSKNEFIENK